MNLPQVLLSGLPTPPPKRLSLQAGPLTLWFENGDLRQIKLGQIEIIRRIYIAVRDRNWGTIPPIIDNLQIDQHPDSFDIEYDVTCRQAAIDFRWHSRITGSSDGSLTFEFDGMVHSNFLRNRIGFCVLHPIAECAGQPCRVSHPDGSTESGFFPEAIAPHQPFTAMTGISHTILPGLQAGLRLKGDLFEMEDQRNWSDASFKTYCTPLALPYPVHVQQGDRICQQITLHLQGEIPIAEPINLPENIQIHIATQSTSNLPALGVCLPDNFNSDQVPADECIRSLGFTHVRLDLDFGNEPVFARLRKADGFAQRFKLGLEITLHLDQDAEEELRLLSASLKQVSSPVLRWIIFRKGELCSSPRWVALARKILSPLTPGATFGGGADSNFTELNRGMQAAPPELDFLVYALNPQVHAFDNLSLAENLSAQAATVYSARQIACGKPVIVSPVTFKPQNNVAATAPDVALAPSQLPPQVDLRQLSLFGAGWTLACIKHLAESGADSLTYYELYGWRGLMETKSGSPLPDQFPSKPNMVYPIWHVFADLAEFQGASILPVHSTGPLCVEGLALSKEGCVWLWLANLSAEEQMVDIQHLSDTVNVRQLDESSYLPATRQPLLWRTRASETITTAAGKLSLPLTPYAIVRIQIQGERL